MKKIVVCIQSNGKFVVGPNGMVALAEKTVEFDWATHTWTYDNDNRNLIIEEGFITVLIVPLERLNYLRVVDIPEEEEPDETH